MSVVNSELCLKVKRVMLIMSSIDLVYSETKPSFKMFLTICMHLFGWLSEGGGNFLNLLQKEGVPRRGEGFPQKREVSFLEETMAC